MDLHMLWNYMCIYSNQKVENLEKLKALTYTLKKTEIPLYLGAHSFLAVLVYSKWSKVLQFVSNFSLILPFPASWGHRLDLTNFLCWKRGLFKATHTMISA